VDLSSKSKTYEIEIKDIQGKTVLSEQRVQGGKLEQLDVNHLENGFYFLILDQGGNRNIEKFIISK
jgi:hypothetical protein